MQIRAIKTPIVRLNTEIESILDVLPELQENSVVAVTSKIISFCEGRCVAKSSADKRQLIKQEADEICELKSVDNPYNLCLTITKGILIPTAGIDESNANDTYVLYPKDPFASAVRIWNYLKEKNNISNLGIVVTDSKTTMMRRGVTGIAVSWCGFKPIYSYINKPDLFDRELQFTCLNVVDALAGAAVFSMGEGDEQTPIAIITDIPKIEFVSSAPTAEDIASVSISKDEDLYGPLLKSVQWEKK